MSVFYICFLASFWTDFCSMSGWMKTPQVATQNSLLVLHRFLSYNFQNGDSEFASLPDSDATVSSENSEGEVLRERERDREGAKK